MENWGKFSNVFHVKLVDISLIIAYICQWLHNTKTLTWIVGGTFLRSLKAMRTMFWWVPNYTVNAPVGILCKNLNVIFLRPPVS